MTRDQNVILVTGGTGLVGSSLQWIIENDMTEQFGRRPEDQWIFVGSKDGDLRKRSDTATIFEKYRPTHIIHLAARVGSLDANKKYVADILIDNMRINDNVLRAAKDYGVKKVVSCLSHRIFPDNIQQPVNELFVHYGQPPRSTYGYGYAKRSIDVMNRAYHKEYGCLFTAAIPTNVFGPNDNHEIDDAHPLYSMVQKCYMAKQHDASFVVNDAEQVLPQYIYSRDLAKLLVWMLREYQEVDPLILGADEHEQLVAKDVADSIAKAMNYHEKCLFNDTQPEEHIQTRLTNAKLRSYLPDFKFTSTDKALNETVRSFLDSYDKHRSCEETVVYR